MHKLPLRVTPSLPRLFAWLCLLLDAVHSFEVLPYVHIDYAYYHRLAQCQTKCTEKYGTLSSRRLLDGSTWPFVDASSEQYQMCELGCSHRSALTARTMRSSAGVNAFTNGQKFWKDSIHDSSTSISSPIDAVRVLCMNPVQSDRTGYLDNFEASVAINMKADFIAPVRYLVQWKQRTAGQKHADETGWITGSIENSTLFKVDGMHPGVQYRFSVVAVSPGGRLGKAVHSEWIEVPSLGTPGASLGSQLTVHTQHNSEDNVSAVLRWSLAARVRKADASLAPARHRVKSRILSCHFRLAYSNETLNGTESFEMDESEGYVLRNLGFRSEYDVTLSNGYFSVSQGLDTGLSSANGTFKSIGCPEVYGIGSLECDPEPVSSLGIDVDADNGTATVTWTPSSEPKHMLIDYRLTYESVDNSAACGHEPYVLYVSKTSTNASILLPNASRRCEYELELTKFDLLMREASARTRFAYTPPVTVPPPPAMSFDSWGHLWIVVAPASVFIALCVVLRFAVCWRKRFKRVAELSSKRLVPPEAV